MGNQKGIGGAKAYIIKDKPKYLLGVGSFGKVLRVTRKADKQVFAMKMSLKISKMLDRKDYQYEENEKTVLKMIDHPFIVKFLDEFMIDGKQCIIMELADKGSL